MVTHYVQKKQNQHVVWFCAPFKCQVSLTSLTKTHWFHLSYAYVMVDGLFYLFPKNVNVKKSSSRKDKPNNNTAFTVSVSATVCQKIVSQIYHPLPRRERNSYQMSPQLSLKAFHELINCSLNWIIEIILHC